MTDREIIEYYGGSTKLAKLLKLDGKHPEMRVHNWKQRGIPASIKLKYEKIFLKKEFKNCAT